jgi:hypothetical protein
MVDEFHTWAAPFKVLLNRYGFVLIRRAVSPDVVRTYREALDEIYALHNANDPRFASCNREEVQALADRGDVSGQIFELFAGRAIEHYFSDLLLRGLLEICLRNPSPTLHTFLTVKPDRGTGGLSLHTDGIVQGTDKAVLTMWSPLDPCGVDAPTLSIVRAGRQKVLRYLQEKFPEHEIPGWCSVTEWNREGVFDERALARTFGSPWFPEMEPGDVVVFTNWTIHGTQSSPHMTKPRSAIIQRWIDDSWL